MNSNDPRVRRTRNLITEAFLDLSKTKDFEEITIGDIAKQADINRSTFYAHFEDKYALLDEIIESTMTFDLASVKVSRLNLMTSIPTLIRKVYAFQQNILQVCSKSALSLHSVIEDRVRAALKLAIAPLFESLDAISKQMLLTHYSAGIFAVVLSWPAGLDDQNLKLRVDFYSKQLIAAIDS